MLYIGIDLGTSAVKLLLMDTHGKILKTVSRTYPLSFPAPGWSEQAPEDWLRQTLDGMAELMADCDRSSVAGIGIAGQMHGLVILDANDQVIRPAILWNDGRTAAETEWLNDVVGRARLTTWTANIAFAGFTAPKLLWLRKHEPENFARIRKIMLPKDYLVYMLSGVHSTDLSDASGTLLLDVQHRCWSPHMLDICGLTLEQLPALHESYEAVGTLKPGYAQALGLPSTVKIAAGAGDNAAAAVGTGTVGNGHCNISIGTSGTIFISSTVFGVDQHNALHAFAHADGHYHLMGCMLSAAACNSWWMDKILGSTDYSGQQAQITDQMLGHNTVYYLPYLMGERSPHNDPAARSVFIGMSMDTTRAQMTQAVLEGVAFAMRDSLEVARSLGLTVTCSKICGGGAKSPLWKKIFANVLDLRLETVETEEGPGYGGAILAAVACGAFDSVQQATDALVRISGTVEPDPGLTDLYAQRYAKFRQIYPALKPIFPILA
jgi:xylulokinase